MPLVGIGLTNEFDDDLNFFPVPTSSPIGGDLLGAGGTPHYDLALLDTGAGVTLLTAQSFSDFGLDAASPGEPDGYEGTESLPIGGATGTLEAGINDAIGLYAGGLQGRSSDSPFAMNSSALRGQTNTSTMTMPAESDLPNVLGLSYASQYATRIRSDQPLIFQTGGKTVRTPSIEFLTLGSGGQGIIRRAPLSLNPGESFQQAPAYFPNIENFDLDNPQENPSIPTIIQGGLFLNVNLANNGSNLNNTSFFFDTGADVSVLSELTALQLGIDVVLDEPDFTIAVIGSGGAKGDVPGYFLDSFTIQAIGGSVTATNVPVVVLDVADPSNSANIVPGIVGTNLLSGRNLVIDPNPSLGGGGASPSLYISDPVTVQRNWTSTATSGAWTTAGNWNGAAPTVLSVVNLRNVASGNQEATLTSNAQAWEVNVSGDAIRDEMKLRVQSGATLTTFAGINIETFGTILLENGTLDAQYVEILGGTLAGVGHIRTGSGPVDGQVENRNGLLTVSNLGVSNPGTLNISGRFANGRDGIIWMSIYFSGSGATSDQIVVEGSVSLDGTLDVDLLANGGPISPQLGQSFALITGESIAGEFSSVLLPTLTADKMWQITYGETEVELKVTLPGDFNGDGTVAGDDLDVWKADNGTLYNGSHFLAWQRNLGMSIAPPLTSVPEPSALALTSVGVMACGMSRRRHRGHSEVSRGI